MILILRLHNVSNAAFLILDDLMYVLCTNVLTVGKLSMSYYISGYTGMISLGLPQNIFRFMVGQSTMITTITLEDRVKATLLQCSPTVTLFMELTR